MSADQIDLIMGYTVLRETPIYIDYTLKLIRVETSRPLSLMDEADFQHLLSSVWATWMGKPNASIRTITFDVTGGLLITLVETA